MNRIIKFRAWDRDGNKMIIPLSPVWFEENYWQDDDFAKCAEHENHILMQFTGLKDKNGKEIWDGDIVKFFVPTIKREYVGKVEFNEDFAAFWLVSKDWSEMDWVKIEGNFEVIGNIYQNPELLKEGENEMCIL